MSDHLRYADADAKTQYAMLEQIVRQQPALMDVLHELLVLALPDPLLPSGAIYNTVCNVLTGRPALSWVNDIDVFYFDDSDIG